MRFCSCPALVYGCFYLGFNVLHLYSKCSTVHSAASSPGKHQLWCRSLFLKCENRSWEKADQAPLRRAPHLRLRSDRDYTHLSERIIWTRDKWTHSTLQQVCPLKTQHRHIIPTLICLLPLREYVSAGKQGHYFKRDKPASTAEEDVGAVPEGSTESSQEINSCFSGWTCSYYTSSGIMSLNAFSILHRANSFTQGLSFHFRSECECSGIFLIK